MNQAPIDGAADFSGVAALLELYWRGLYEGDADLLARAFHPHALYATASSGALLHHDLESYLEIVRNRPAPRSAGDQNDYAIRSISFAGPNAAVAQVSCGFLGRQFTDLLTLVRAAGEWRILSKVFHYEEAPGAFNQPAKDA